MATHEVSFCQSRTRRALARATAHVSTIFPQSSVVSLGPGQTCWLGSASGRLLTRGSPPTQSAPLLRRSSERKWRARARDSRRRLSRIETERNDAVGHPGGGRVGSVASGSCLTGEMVGSGRPVAKSATRSLQTEAQSAPISDSDQHVKTLSNRTDLCFEGSAILRARW